jgi:hypothetical protein
MNVDERISQSLRSMAVDNDSPPPIDAVSARIGVHRRRRQRVKAATAVLALGCTIAMVAALSPDRQRRLEAADSTLVGSTASGASTPDSSTGPATTAAQEPIVQAFDGWQALPAAPIEPRNRYAIAVADGRLLVWGGSQYISDNEDRPMVDGAILDVATGVWTVLPEAPLDAAWSPVAVAIDNGEFVVVGGARAALYSQATGEWTGLPEHGASAVTGAVWTGTDVILAPSGPAYNVQRGEWREVASPPEGITSQAQSVVWTGKEMIVTDSTAIGAYSLDDDSWRSITHPFAQSYGFGAAWTGREMVLVEQFGQNAFYDPDQDEWRTGDTVPISPSVCQADVLAAGGAVVVRLCGADALTANGSTWTPFVPAAGNPIAERAVSDGTTVYTWSASLVAVLPASDALSAEMPVGMLTLDRTLYPTAARATGSAYQPTLEADIRIAGAKCTVRAGQSVFAAELDLGEFDETTHLAPQRIEGDGVVWLAGGRRDRTWAVGCPDEESGRAALAQIRFAGEATEWREAPDVLAELQALENTANTSSIEQMYGAALVEILARGGGEPRLAYIDYEYLLGVVGIGDDAADYLEYLFQLDAAGKLTGLQVRAVCARGLAAPDMCV